LAAAADGLGDEAKLGGVCCGPAVDVDGTAAGRFSPEDATCEVCGCIPDGEAATD